MKKDPIKPKRIVEDVVPRSRSIRNVVLPSRQNQIQKEEKKKVEVPEIKIPITVSPKPVSPMAPPPYSTYPPISTPPPTPPPPPPPPKVPSYSYEYDSPKKSPSRKVLYVVIAVFVLALAGGVSAMFKSADIRITPKNEVHYLNDSFLAKKNATGSDLGFQVVTVSRDVEKKVEATGQEKVEKKAQGRVVLYNKTSQTQKLVATTRLETSGGLIFRLTNAATIPASTVVGGRNVAGSVETNVVADAIGAKYNIDLTDFTLPGLKGSSKYTDIYARSKTAMTGGISGMQKIVGKDVLASADSSMESSLKSDLARDIVSQIPANFVLYKDDLTYSFDPIIQAPMPVSESSATSSAILRKKGTVHAVIFEREALSRAIVEKVLATSTSDQIKVVNLETFNFSYISGTSTDPLSLSSLGFNLTGQANFVWIVDTNKIASEILGVSKTSAKTVISTYGAIQESWITTHPFWNTTIPNDPKKVKVTNTLQ